MALDLDNMGEDGSDGTEGKIKLSVAGDGFAKSAFPWRASSVSIKRECARQPGQDRQKLYVHDVAIV